MKITLMFLLTASALCFAQFSSGTDYSVKKEKASDLAGAVFHFEKNETEWSIDYSAGENFSARSQVFGYGYGLFGKNYFEDTAVIYSADHIIRVLTGSVTVDTTSTSDQTINYDLGDLTVQDIRAEAGVYYKNKFGIFGNVSYYSFDETDKNSARFGIRGEYLHNFSSGKTLLLSCGFSTSGDEDVIRGLSIVSEISPVSDFGAVLTVPFESSELGVLINFSGYESSMVNDKDENYIKAELSYKYLIPKAQSTISAVFGTNLSAGMELPEIHLPYFYNVIEFGNKMFKDRIDLSVGWKYEMYEAVLGDRSDLVALMPDEITSADKLSETAAYNKVFIKIGFLY
jgi:hypothetical protein